MINRFKKKISEITFLKMAAGCKNFPIKDVVAIF